MRVLIFNPVQVHCNPACSHPSLCIPRHSHAPLCNPICTYWCLSTLCIPDYEFFGGPCSLVRPLARHVLVWVPLHAHVFLFITGAFVQNHAFLYKFVFLEVIWGPLQPPPYSHVIFLRTPMHFHVFLCVLTYPECSCAYLCLPVHATAFPMHFHAFLYILMHPLFAFSFAYAPVHLYVFFCIPILSFAFLWGLKWWNITLWNPGREAPNRKDWKPLLLNAYEYCCSFIWRQALFVQWVFQLSK